MSPNRRIQILGGLLVALALVAIVVLTRTAALQKPPPSAPGYYTGPFRSKGDPNRYATDDGKIVPPPSGVKITPNASNSGAAHKPARE